MTGAELLRRDHEVLRRALVVAIAAHVPDFNLGIEDARHPLRRARQAVLELSLTKLADAVDARYHPEAHERFDFGPHRELGRMECRYGRPLTAILQAPWAASLAIWRHAVARAPDLGIGPEVLHDLAEAVIDWSDRISVAFSEGYNDESAARAGETEARRQRLVELLLADPPPSAEAVDAAARHAGWRPPRRLRVLLVAGDGRSCYRRGLPGGAVAAELGDRLCVLLPEPSPLPDALRERLAPDVAAALSPVADLRQAHRGTAQANAALALAADGVFDRSRLVDCEDHKLALLLLADRDLALRYSSELLHAVEHKPGLVETLAAWLRHHGRPKATAQELGVHPHTVGYRINRLRDLLGPIVDDPDRRPELEIAVRIHRLLKPPAAS